MENGCHSTPFSIGSVAAPRTNEAMNKNPTAAQRIDDWRITGWRVDSALSSLYALSKATSSHYILRWTLALSVLPDRATRPALTTFASKQVTSEKTARLFIGKTPTPWAESLLAHISPS